MRTTVSVLALGLLLGACQPAKKPGSNPAPQQQGAASAQPVIRGRATYLERVKMPPGADLVVQLLDTRRAGTQPAVIASVRLDDVAGPPFPFTLPYDPAKLRAEGSHGLHASLHGPDGALWFATGTPIPVTPGDAAIVEVRMLRVPGEGEAVPQARGSPWEDAKARGVAFRGVGNEPGWFVEVDQGPAPALRATLDYGERKVDALPVAPLTGDLGYAGKTASGLPVLLRIQRASCSDGMSDASYPASAELSVGDDVYRGCGRFLLE